MLSRTANIKIINEIGPKRSSDHTCYANRFYLFNLRTLRGCAGSIARLNLYQRKPKGAKNESRYSDCTGGLQWSEITIPRNALRHAGYGDHAKRRNEYQTEFFIHVYDLPKLGAPDWQKLPPASLMKITIHGHRAVISVGARSC